MKLYAFILVYAFFGKCISCEEDISNLPDICFFSFINSYNERIFCWLMKLYAHILVYAFFGKCISGEDISNLTDIFFPLASINVSVLED